MFADPTPSSVSTRSSCEIADTSITSSAVAPAFAKIAQNELSQVRRDVTIGEWCKLHPNDSLVVFTYKFDDPSNEEWCIRAEQTFQLKPSRQIAVRYAYFYAPFPAPGLALPSLRDSLRVRANTAVLGMIWVEVIERSVQASTIIVDTLRSQLSKWLGAGAIDPKMFYHGSSAWGRRTRWQVGDKIFASAHRVTPVYHDAPTVAAFGFLPISNVHIDWDYDKFPIGGVPSDADSILFQRTLRCLQQDVATAKTLANAYFHWHLDPLDSVDNTSMLLEFRRWMGLQDNAINEKRAAMLLFADQVLDAINRTLDTATISQYRLLGAIFAESRTAGWIYERSWLKQARSLDSNGTVGDIALMIMIQKGFQFQVDCHDCGQCFGNVIVEGEKFLLRTKDTWFRKMTHLALGYAHTDIVALDSGIESLAREDSGIQMNTDAARFQAVEHFRKAIELDTTATDSRLAWRVAWRLVAGIPPQGVTFTCADE